MGTMEGPIVLADVSGYSRYVGGVELEHSRDVLADLLDVIATRLGDTLTIEKIEGDAILCAGDENVSAGDVVTAIDDTYVAFANRRRTISVATSCECDACRRIPELDLKFLAHQGEYTEQQVAGRRELFGPDVILAHRLLKNTVTAETGIGAYALYTESLIAGLDGATALGEMPIHRESYDDCGEVSGRVRDLAAHWAEEQERSPVRIERGAEDFLFEADLAAAPARVWQAMTDPAEQLRWRVAVDRYDTESPSGGRGVGTVAHCVHGRSTHTQEIADWKPYEYFSYYEQNPAGRCLYTVELNPLANENGHGRTRMTWRIQLAGGRVQRLMIKMMGGRLRKALDTNLTSFVAYVGAG